MSGSTVEAGFPNVLREPCRDIWYTNLQGAVIAADEQVAAGQQSRARWRRRCSGPCRRGMSALVGGGVVAPEAGESGQDGSSRRKKWRRAGGTEPRILHPRCCLTAKFCSTGN